MCVAQFGVSEDGGGGAGVWGFFVLPLLSPFRPPRRGGSGGSSGVDLRLCFSGRPWWRGEEREVVGVPFWLQVALVVFFVDASALAGRGGEGSCVRRW